MKSGKYAGIIHEKPRTLARTVKKNLKVLSGEYKRAKESSPFWSWLSDNFHILERCASAVTRELYITPPIPSDPKTLMPLLYEEILDFTLNEPLTQIGLQNKIGSLGRSLTSREFAAMPSMLRAAYLTNAANSVYGKNTELLSGAIIGIRSVDDIDFDIILKNYCEVEKILSGDPAGVYESMDEATKFMYRKSVADLSEESGVNEAEYAEMILKKALGANEFKLRHVGAYLTKREKKYALRGKCAIVFYFVFPLVFSLLISALLNALYLLPLLYFPLWSALKIFVDIIFLRGVPATYLPRMNRETTREEMPHALITVSTLLPNAEKSGELYERFETLFLTSGRSGAYFCALADLKASDGTHSSEDDANISAARREFKRLSEKYGDRFFLLVRKREYSKTQDTYCGKERKRGAITSLIRLIKEGESGEFCAVQGDIDSLRKIKYVIALDSDTALSPESAETLIAAMIHPLCRAEIDRDKGIVTDGYGIISPRVGVTLEGMNQTVFSKVMTGAGGIEAYNTVCSELYQDLFSEGIFAGKGVIDVDTFYELLNDFFEEESVLSHDILEGCFLRNASQSDVEVYDSFPKNCDAMLDRAHRWIRGDIQNIVWLFGRVRTAKGKIKNPLGFVSKFKLFDNVRRAVTPIISVLGLFLSMLMPNGAATAAVAVSVLSASFGNIYSFFRTLLSGGFYTFSARYYSGVIPAALSSLMCALINIAMLPQTAYENLDACVRALYRTFISRKNMLQWVVSAEAGGRKGAGEFILRYLPSILTGAFFVIFGSAFLKLLGIVFIAFAVFAGASNVQIKDRVTEISYHQREKLLRHAAAMWKYYEELCTLEDNFLPPDNVQEAPVYKIAHRTSPTNIGLMLTSTLAARDFGFIDTDTMCFRLKNSLASLVKMQKYRGNLFNWYDTRTLEPLSPRYVSTVDTGNFLCCLTALRQGLYEYEGESEEIKGICDIIGNLIADTDIGFLYNKKRKLFHIGCDAESASLTNSYYDLLMSEARMTSYYAVADGSVPAEHWGALGRPLSRESGFMGAVSWTGTMFEYYMPQMFLPSLRGTLTDESLKFCLLCQRKRAHGKSPVWGISESGYYAFDDSLSYQYKAFGVQKLGLKRDMDCELVISPYSSFLTAPTAFSAAYKNILKAERLGLSGRFGLYEAADFTRCDSGRFSIVRSYMAHHVGMSLLSVCNALKGNIMQKRFMSDSRMRSAEPLLTEKIPSGGIVLKNLKREKSDNHHERYEFFEEKLLSIDPAMPKCAVFGGGETSCVFTDSGISFGIYKNIDTSVRTVDFLGRPHGFFAVLKNESMVLSATRAPDYSSDGMHECTFLADSVVYTSEKGGIKLKMTASLEEQGACEIREIKVQNSSGRAFSGEMYLYFTPCLTEFESYRTHPAFSDIMLCSRYDKGSGTILFEKKKGENSGAAALSVGFLKDTDFTFETVRSNVLTTPRGTKCLTDIKPIAVKNSVTQTDVCALIKLRVNLSPRSKKKFTLLISAGGSASEALGKTEKLRREKKPALARSAFSQGSLDFALCKKLLPNILFPNTVRQEHLPLISQNACGVNALWKAGISGDLPAVLVKITCEKDIRELYSYMSLHRKLRKCFINFDLVIMYRENGEYDAPIRSSIKSISLKFGGMEASCGKGGVHEINENDFSPEELNTITAFCACISRNEKDFDMPAMSPARIYFSAPLCAEGGVNTLKTVCGEFTDESFRVLAPPVVPWCNVYANENFGTLLSSNSLGFTWAVNSRENRLTPWNNDASFDNLGERLFLKTGGRIYDLISGSCAEFYKDRAVYRGCADGILFIVTVRVPQKGMTKIIDVALKNAGNERRDMLLAYYTEPVMDFDRRNARFLTSSESENGIVIKNTFGGIGGFMLVGERSGVDFFTSSMRNALSGEWEVNDLLPQSENCVLVGKRFSLLPNDKASAGFMLSFSMSEDALGVYEDVVGQDNYVKIKTGDCALDKLFNTWLLKQTLEGRVLARTGFYQSSGAWGFRDQLQDICSLIMLYPDLARRHIIRASGRQFYEGDVLHWWHEIFGKVRGVRTRYSDDMLFLPYAACLYAEKTGDYSLFDVETAYLSGDELSEAETERYCTFEQGEIKESIFEHCHKALRRAMNTGAHSLLLIGGGDWNDGFNKVGILGRGESVWLTQFYIIVSERFASVCEKRGHTDLQKELTANADMLRRAVDESAWDGDRYVRAYCDSGEVMGSHTDTECKADSLTQSFSVFCDMPDKDRVNIALSTALRELADEENGVVRLLSPGFNGKNKVGYIESYPEGIRENGGQYTHAACWLAMALFRAGRADEGYEILKILNPVNKYKNAQTAAVYKKEPYYLAGDVYYGKDTKGVGGWSIYTGAAAWYYRTVLEEMLGIKQVHGRIRVSPSLPSCMNEYSAVIKIGSTEISILAKRGVNKGLTLDGETSNDIPLDGKKHSATVIF